MAGAKTYSIRDLQALAGVKARTVRHWVRKRVLPKPLGKGRGARYTEGHVLRAKVTRQLRAQGASLPAIRLRLEGLADEQLQALLQSVTPSVSPAVRVPPPEPNYPAVSWELVTLMDGLVLMVSSKGGAGLRRVAADIYRYYGGGVGRMG
jgi:DNA-binding transcriptional MerR regulator